MLSGLGKGGVGCRSWHRLMLSGPGTGWGESGTPPSWLLSCHVLPAISNWSGISAISLFMAMSATGPRITTGRLKLAGKWRKWRGQVRGQGAQARSLGS